jgi:hypothetical protein
VNIDDVDLLKFPDFFRAERYSCVLDAGELLLLPACWWHQVTSIDTSISVNYWWKADLDSLLASNVAQMMREIGRTGTLTVLQPFLANLHGGVSFIDAAIRAQQVGRHWICVMLALAALEEFVIAEGRRIGMWEGRYVISIDACKAGHQLLAVGVLTRDDLERLEAAAARAHHIREIPFEQACGDDAQFMIDQATAILKKP